MQLVAAQARLRQTVDKAGIYAQAGLGLTYGPRNDLWRLGVIPRAAAREVAISRLPVRDGRRAETVAPPRS
ncbi:UNVERIFIED_ORG: hypothetical protein FHR35_007953 [Microbispora rosea subsp. rosea]|nr:hypothetical protein Misp03_56840 [Microbispora sp. NBRC 16548]